MIMPQALLKRSAGFRCSSERRIKKRRQSKFLAAFSLLPRKIPIFFDIID